MYPGAGCARAFAATSHPPLAHFKTPIALVVQVLAARTEGGGLHAATRLYGVSKNSIYRWQERLSGLKKHCGCLLGRISFYHSSLQEMSGTRGARSMLLRTSHKAGPGC